MLLPSSAANPANMIAQALTMYKSLINDGANSGFQLTPAEEPFVKVVTDKHQSKNWSSLTGDFSWAALLEAVVDGKQ